MDEMRIRTGLMRSLVGKLIAKKIKRKTGYKVKIDLHDLQVTVIDGVAHLTLSVDTEMNNVEFKKLIHGLTEEEES